jgi:hypothetical protein
MTELRQRMQDAMVQRGFAQRTQETYIHAIRRMAQHYRRDPASYTPEEVQAYLLHMVKERKLSYSSTIPGRLRRPVSVPNRTGPWARPVSHRLCQSPRQATRAIGSRRDIAPVCRHVLARADVSCCKPSTPLVCGCQKPAP